MKLLLLRFALFLSMAAGITAMAMAQTGGAPDAATSADTDRACVLEEIAKVASEAIEGRERRQGSGTRVVRWQSLIPGAVR